MLIVEDDGGSSLSFYTLEEKLYAFANPGWRLPEEELQARMDEAMEEWLESDIRQMIIQDKLDVVLKKYPNIDFDADIMKEIANTLILVREKFDILRDMNMELERATMNSYELAKKGQNIHLSRLISFMYAYIFALSRKYRETELALILKLPAILNKELGNLTGLQDIPKIFIEGVGKGIGGIISIGTSFFSDAVKGIASGLGLDSELLKKIGIGLIIAVPLIGIGYVFIKLKKKKRKKA